MNMSTASEELVEWATRDVPVRSMGRSVNANDLLKILSQAGLEVPDFLGGGGGGSYGEFI